MSASAVASGVRITTGGKRFVFDNLEEVGTCCTLPCPLFPIHRRPRLWGFSSNNFPLSTAPKTLPQASYGISGFLS